MRLLLVEDDTMIGEAVLDALRGAHYAVDWVRDGEMADTALASQDYDLVLLDLGLPKRDGLEVLRRLRARKSITPVLIATARDAIGDRIAVRPGDRIAADGLVRQGTSAIDTAPITGESVPVEVAPGATVAAGTINLAGLIEVEVTATGSNTTLGRVVQLMRTAEGAKPPVTRLLERYAGSYLLLILLVAGCVLSIGWRSPTGTMDAVRGA